MTTVHQDKLLKDVRDGIDALENELGAAQSTITDLKRELADAHNSINEMCDRIHELEDELKNAKD